jgi:hypothetical protein
MQYSDDYFSPDDKCYLFLNFPFDWSFSSKLPIEVAPGICLTLTPQHALACAAPQGSSVESQIGLAAWVYPGYGLEMRMCNVCIKIDAKVPAELRDRYFWFFIEAVYLVKPLYISIAGAFSYGTLEEGFVGANPSRIGHRSNICAEPFFGDPKGGNLCYSEKELKQAGIYFSRIVEIFNSRTTAARPYFNLKAFFEATLWERSIYASTSFSKLFPLIDSFAGNPSHDHDKKVSKRFSLFLKGITGPQLYEAMSEERVKSRILSIWHDHRAPDLHGYLKELDFPVLNAETKNPVDKSELKDLFDLMEFSRLAIIKMLHLEKDYFKEYCEIPIPLRKYKDKADRVASEKARENASKAFFEEKNYPSPKGIIAYTDFKGQLVEEMSVELTSQALTV